MLEQNKSIINVNLKSIKLATVSNFLQQVKTILQNQTVITDLISVGIFNGLISELQTAMVAKQG